MTFRKGAIRGKEKGKPKIAAQTSIPYADKMHVKPEIFDADMNTWVRSSREGRAGNKGSPVTASEMKRVVVYGEVS